MASRPYFVADRGCWYVKWKAPSGWKAVRLCKHPGWEKGQKAPKRPPPEAARLARVWEDREAAARHGIDPDHARPVALATFLDDYLQIAGAGQAPGSMRLLRRVAGQFAVWCEGRKVRTLAQVTAEVCRRYLADRAGQVNPKTGKTIARSTIATERGVLAPAWAIAFRDGRVRENPWTRVTTPGKARQEHPPYWTEAEVRKLAEVCQPWLRDVVIVGAYAGLRITALLGMEWRDVDFAAGTIHVRAVRSKSGRPYDAPMLGPARDVLQQRVATSEGELVFVGPKLGRKMRAEHTYERIGEAVARAGIPDHGAYNHCLRHSFGTWAVNRGVPLKVVSEWMGHSSIRMTMRYAHNDPRESTRWAEHFDSGSSGGG